MAGNVKPIPDNYHSVTPYLTVDGAEKAIDFYKRAFGATELMRMPAPENKIAHAEIKIGDSVVMLCDPMKEMGHKSPKTLGGTPVTLLVYVPDVDATVAGALQAGAEALRPVEDQFWGDRMGGVTDPFGHQWFVATHVEDVSPEEMERRMESLAAAPK
jgi:PhnB protein